ncbi:hypothetical protein IFM89_021209 [Coptis chinensis]|uniref:Reverse transcriptase n=1 Tax=Coptis chinensis TaxID=261450 RepID=A0A835HG80_9MAGN|nr:hypothetical protein IFM89_021209 [Coptis chinensis]
MQDGKTGKERRLTCDALAIGTKITEATHNLEALQYQFEQDENEMLAMEIAEQELQVENLLQQEADYWKQRSRTRWDKEVDRSTKYFHNLINMRKSKAMIREIQDAHGVTLKDQEDISRFIVSHYTEKFKEEEIELYVNLLNLIPKLVIEEENKELPCIPIFGEIKRAVFGLCPDSAPGPDGFNGHFYQVCWNIVGGEVYRLVIYFFLKRKLPKSYNVNFIVLIPKERNANQLNRSVMGY